jgi:type IV pilus assembly protein PilF
MYYWLFFIFILFTLFTACSSQPVINHNNFQQLNSLDDLQKVNYDISQIKFYQPEEAAKTNMELGIEYMKRGDFSISLERMRRAISIDPNYADAHGMLAVLYERLGQTKEAHEHYEQALQLEVYNSVIQNNYGSFLCKQGQTEQANRAFLIALSNPIYEQPEQPATNAAVCSLRNKNYVQAEQYLRYVLSRLNPDYSPAIYQMAVLHFETKRYNIAEDYLLRYLKNQPHTPQTLWLGIKIARALGDRSTEAGYARTLRSDFKDALEVQWLDQGLYHD